MKNKYVVVRSCSTTGPYIVERNGDAPRLLQWSKADIAGYADTKAEADRLARDCEPVDTADGPRMLCSTCRDAEVSR